MLKYVPGTVAAIAAFAAIRITPWLQSFWLEGLVFLTAYLVVAVSVDKALTRYGT